MKNIIIQILLVLVSSSLIGQKDKDRWYNLSYEEEQIILNLRDKPSMEVLSMVPLDYRKIDYSNPFMVAAFSPNTEYEVSGILDPLKRIYTVGMMLFGSEIKKMAAGYLDPDCKDYREALIADGIKYRENAIKFFEFQQSIRP